MRIVSENEYSRILITFEGGKFKYRGKSLTPKEAYLKWARYDIPVSHSAGKQLVKRKAWR